MMRVIAYALGVLLLVFITRVVYVSMDDVVPFARLDLTVLRLDGRRAVAGTDENGRENGRVLVSFAWRSHTRGARCVRVKSDVKVGVGGVLARPVRLGGGAWAIGDVVPLPWHRCVNEALFEVDRALLPGIVGASLGDGRGKPALISAVDLVAPPVVVIASPQPARVGERATVEVFPDTLAISRQPLVQRGTSQAWPVDVERHRISFTVPPRWEPGDAPVRVATDRIATVLRCQRAPTCLAFGVPVDDAVPFVVETKGEPKAEANAEAK